LVRIRKKKDVKQVLDSAIDAIDAIDSIDGIDKIDTIDAVLDRQRIFLGQTDNTIIGETFVVTKEKTSSSSNGV
jgi:hypothetical protein|tara:strand:- start:145 stop:366 length:222 start_codon:yes stop_codon:yes gene_type:complete